MNSMGQQAVVTHLIMRFMHSTLSLIFFWLQLMLRSLQTSHQC